MKEITYSLLNASTPIAVREIPLTERQKIILRYRQLGRYPLHDRPNRNR